MKLPRIGRLVAFVVLASALCATGFAQKVTGDITGSVSDASGAVLAGATVTAENTGTGLKRTVTTSGTGAYSIPELPPGTYKMTATANGFKTTSRDTSVVAAQTTTSNFALEVGAQTEVVNVEATAPIIEYSGNLNNSLDNATIAETPLSGRDFQQLVNINPGVVRIPGGGFQSITINGQREDSNNYFVDGFYNNDRFYGDAAIGETGIVGIPATVIPPEAVQEMTVQQTPSAEFGVKSGAPIITNLKTGTNTFHGDAHWYRHTEVTDAANYFAKHDPDSCDASVTDCRSHLKNNQYGGLLSGPIWKDKTFFMGFFEGQRLNFDNPYVAPVPTPAAVAQARADIAAAGLTTNPVGEALLSFYPTDPSGGILTNIPTRAELDEFGVKIDHQFGANQRLSGRYIFADSFQSAGAFTGTVAPPPPNPPDMFNSVAPSRAQIFGVSHFLNLGSNKILESRFGVTRFSQLIDINNKVNPLDLGINTGPLDPADFGVPAVYYLGYIYGYIGGVGGYPITTRPNQTYDWSEHFSWIKGNHSMKMGGNFQRARTNSVRNRARTVLNVVNGWDDGDDTTDDSHNSIAQLLLGRFDDVSRTFGSTDRVITQNSLGFYFQDDWRVRSNLSLSFGMRYDIAGNVNEENEQASNFIPGVGLVKVGNGIDSLYNIDKNNWGPRFGFAWDPWSNGKTSVRGGYALTYDLPLFGAILAPRTTFVGGAAAGSFSNPDLGVFPKILAGDFEASSPTDPAATCVDPSDPTTAANFVCVQPGVPIFGANPTGDPPFSAFSIDRDLKTAMIHNFNLSVQQELWSKNVLTVSYVGTQGRNQYAYRDLNAFPIGCSLTVGGCVRPFEADFPDLAHIIQLTDDSKHWYDAMQVQFRQQAWHGLTNQTNFTWSNCRDLNSNSRSSRANFFQSQNPYDPEENKGPCDHDQRRKFTNSIVYDIPNFGLGRFGKGWEVASLIQLSDGTPFNPTLASFDPSDQDTHSIRPNYNGGAIEYNPRDPDNYIANGDEVFSTPPDGTIGNARRNMLQGPGFAQWDMTLAKSTQITERLNVQFRWEVFNVLNRANFGVVNNGTRSSNFGRIFSTPDVDAINPLAEGGPRTMQFALKLRF
jgi:hypothetical protein